MYILVQYKKEMYFSSGIMFFTWNDVNNIPTMQLTWIETYSDILIKLFKIVCLFNIVIYNIICHYKKIHAIYFELSL